MIIVPNLLKLEAWQLTHGSGYKEEIYLDWFNLYPMNSRRTFQIILKESDQNNQIKITVISPYKKFENMW